MQNAIRIVVNKYIDQIRLLGSVSVANRFEMTGEIEDIFMSYPIILTPLNFEPFITSLQHYNLIIETPNENLSRAESIYFYL